MLTSSRSFEAVRNATRRDHLMPVERETLHVSPAEQWALAGIWLVVLPVLVGFGAWVLS